MNAYELAKELEACFTKADWNVLEAPNMLRSQSELIASLQESNRQQADKLHKYELRNQEQIKRIAELEKE